MVALLTPPPVVALAIVLGAVALAFAVGLWRAARPVSVTAWPDEDAEVWGVSIPVIPHEPFRGWPQPLETTDGGPDGTERVAAHDDSLLPAIMVATILTSPDDADRSHSEDAPSTAAVVETPDNAGDAPAGFDAASWR